MIPAVNFSLVTTDLVSLVFDRGSRSLQLMYISLTHFLVFLEGLSRFLLDLCAF